MSDKDENHDRSKTNCIGVGVALGAGFGAAFGAALDNVGIGVGLGTAFGIIFGVARSKSEAEGGDDVEQRDDADELE